MAKNVKFIAELAKRISQVIDESGKTQSEVARRMGVESSLLNRWKQGKQEASPAHLSNFIKVTGCDGGWLLTGEGEMFRGKSDSGGEIEKLKEIIINLLKGESTTKKIG